MPQPPKKSNAGYKGGLPSLDVKLGGVLDTLRKVAAPKQENIPNASLVYGVAAAVLGTIALYYFFTGVWFTGLLVFVVACALFGFALVYMRYGAK